MYSGTTFRKSSGGFIGVHQKIDRVARRSLTDALGKNASFPKLKDILHFEGNNGPDGIKRKSPSVDEPWHYIDPTNPDDTQLLDMIRDHHANLVQALKKHDQTKAAFEAAWLSHAIVDGLTPAHHYPLSDMIEELWGKPKEERLTIIDKNLIRGASRRDTISKNWQYWGAKGVWPTHFLFEWGVATTVKSNRFIMEQPSKPWLEAAHERGLERVFLDSLEHIYALDMYHNFWNNGWTAKLARQTRETLMPLHIQTVAYSWYSAYKEAFPEGETE